MLKHSRGFKNAWKIIFSFSDIIKYLCHLYIKQALLFTTTIEGNTPKVIYAQLQVSGLGP